jgi:hypothetical protein
MTEWAKWRTTGEMPAAAEDTNTSSAVSPKDAKADDAGASADESVEESATSDEDSEQDDEQDDKPERDENGKFKRKSGMERRFAKLTRANAELQRQLEEARKTPPTEAAAANTTKQTDTAPGAKPRPEMKDFASIEDWTDAVTDWKLEQKEAQKQAAAAQEAQKQKQAEARTKVENIVAEGTKKYGEDFADAVDAMKSVPPHIAKAVIDSDLSTALVNALGNDPAELKRITALPEHRALVEIGKLEAKLAEPQTSPAKRATSAPKPPSTINRATAPKVGLSDELPIGEWAKRRLAQKA